MRSNHLASVMPALVAGIHVFLRGVSKKGVDGRDKPGHDSEMNGSISPRRHSGKHTLQKRRSTILAAIAFLGLAWPATWPTALPAQQALQERLVEQSSGIPAAQVATGRHGMVASQDSQATRIGLNVL